ncbi:MAG: hypothetical protein QGI45_03465 [Myxococcota bacterium]|jgi:hypothetical protein|nr:hypothetical protein [Myxococcota bacterium]
MQTPLFIKTTCIWLLALSLNGCIHNPKDSLEGQTKPIEINLSQAIKDGAAYLLKDVTAQGAFLYRSNTNPKTKVKKKYNWLRHAGTLYSLAAYVDWAKDRAPVEKIERTAKYLLETAVAPLQEDPRMQAVWSLEQHTGKKAPPTAKLGGSGIALVGLLSLEKISPGFNQKEKLEALGRFLKFMQKADGGFYSKYIPSKVGRDDSWTSLYYPGEAALGLAMLYEYTQDKQWLECSINALGYLARLRQGRARVEPDHWALLASQRVLLHLEKVPDTTVSKALLLEHAASISKSIMRGQMKTPGGSMPEGAFDSNARTTPVATRLEGLLAAYTFLPQTHMSLRKEISTTAHPSIQLLLQSQIQEGDFKGAVPRSYFGNPRNAAQAPDRRSTEIRIDYNQHFISALMQYSDAFYPKVKKIIRQK